MDLCGKRTAISASIVGSSSNFLGTMFDLPLDGVSCRTLPTGVVDPVFGVVDGVFGLIGVVTLPEFGLVNRTPLDTELDLTRGFVGVIGTMSFGSILRLPFLTTLFGLSLWIEVTIVVSMSSSFSLPLFFFVEGLLVFGFDVSLGVLVVGTFSDWE